MASCFAAAIWMAVGAQAASFGGNCVAYARQATGISLDGNAGAWWSQAEGRYERGQKPAVGAVLVFKPSGHMRVGHVAVLSKVVNPREILVDQANWVRGRIVKGMSVIDASPNNDWTVVKVVELHSGTHGRPNLTYGFVYPRKPPVSDTVVAARAEQKPPAKLPVQLAVASANDGPADLVKRSVAKATATKQDEKATTKDHPKPQHSAAVRVPGHHAEGAKQLSAKPPKDHSMSQRDAAWISSPTAFVPTRGERFAEDKSMAGKNQHVLPHQGKWAVKGEGNQRATSIHGTQAEATERAREIARREKSELLVHGRDGQVRSRDSFGHDPFPPKG